MDISKIIVQIGKKLQNLDEESLTKLENGQFTFLFLEKQNKENISIGHIKEQFAQLSTFQEKEAFLKTQPLQVLKELGKIYKVNVKKLDASVIIEKILTIGEQNKNNMKNFIIARQKVHDL